VHGVLSSSISFRGPRLPLLTQLIAGSLFGFWVIYTNVEAFLERFQAWREGRQLAPARELLAGAIADAPAATGRLAS
jgi:hypothetical protein